MGCLPTNTQFDELKEVYDDKLGMKFWQTTSKKSGQNLMITFALVSLGVSFLFLFFM